MSSVFRSIRSRGVLAAKVAADTQRREDAVTPPVRLSEGFKLVASFREGASRETRFRNIYKERRLHQRRQNRRHKREMKYFLN